jgi:uncharacterized membrane protein
MLHLVVLVPPLSPVRAVVALPILLVLPGGLLLRVLGERWRGWPGLVLAVPLSMALLMAAGSVLAVLPGAALATGACLALVDVVVVLLTVFAGLRSRPVVTRRRSRIRITVSGIVGPVAGAAGLALVVTGAGRLNANHSATMTMAGLGCVVVAVAAAVAASERRRTGAAATTIYLAGLAVLLATSLRGTVVSGHDIKIEYRVFLDTLVAGSWEPGGPYPGYNSCLSLTVLPAMLVKLLGIAALDVFRVCFQMVFALVPVGVFLVARRLLRPAYAVLSAGLFIAFPTFVNDMPMLNRQEIALLFFTAGLFVLLDRRAPVARRTALLLIMAAGLTVSHYSSAAVCAAMLSLAWLLHRLRRRHGPAVPVRPGPGAAAATMIVLVLGWSALTGSAAAFGADLAGTARAVFTGADVESGASSYWFGGRAPADDPEALRTYLTELTAARPAVGARPPTNGAEPVVIPADELPTTVLGGALADVGISPEAVNTVVRQAVVLLFEGGAVVGCVLLWLRRRRSTAVPRSALPDVAEWALAGILLLAAAVVLPQVTDSYGLLRLYQQLLPVLGITVVVALIEASRVLRRPRWTGRIAAGLVIGALVTTSGLLPRATGGYPPQLNLAAGGPYFRAYLAGSDDVTVARLVRADVPADAWIVADSRDTLNLRALADRQPEEGVAPGAVPDDAYLLVGLAGPGDVLAVAVVGDRVIRYTFALADVNRGRRIVFRTADHVLYTPYGR